MPASRRPSGDAGAPARAPPDRQRPCAPRVSGRGRRSRPVAFWIRSRRAGSAPGVAPGRADRDAASQVRVSVMARGTSAYCDVPQHQEHGAVRQRRRRGRRLTSTDPSSSPGTTRPRCCTPGSGPDDFMAQVMSAVYVVWIVLVPTSIAIALVWTRHTSAGVVVRHRGRRGLVLGAAALPAAAVARRRSMPGPGSPTCRTPPPLADPAGKGMWATTDRGRRHGRPWGPAPCRPWRRSRPCTSAS